MLWTCRSKQPYWIQIATVLSPCSTAHQTEEAIGARTNSLHSSAVQDPLSYRTNDTWTALKVWIQCRHTNIYPQSKEKPTNKNNNIIQFLPLSSTTTMQWVGQKVSVSSRTSTSTNTKQFILSTYNRMMKTHPICFASIIDFVLPSMMN